MEFNQIFDLLKSQAIAPFNVAISKSLLPLKIGPAVERSVQSFSSLFTLGVVRDSD